MRKGRFASGRRSEGLTINCYGMTIPDDYAVLSVGANGCSPEREPCKRRDLTYGEPGLGFSLLAE
ncbi:hypothetical protein Y697_07865 [Mesotoga sp. BH458_6_3_2_1]|nr:hypothetical protein Y697_07865 [Mesotoga sp. BH458_6_3_2_1]